MAARDSEPLLGTNRFQVVIGDREVGFSQVGRLTSFTAPDVDPGAERHRFETVLLRRALTRSSELYEWRARTAAGVDDRRPVTIQQLDAAGEVVNSWRLERAWPCRWSGPAFDALANDLAVEELEIAFEGLVWIEDPDARNATGGA